MMKHLFISALQTPIEGWVKAFPKLRTMSSLALKEIEESPIIWVHIMLEQTVQWQQVVRAITMMKPNAKIIVISNNPDQSEAMQALSLGAVGYLHAYSHPKVLKEVSSVVMHDGVWLGQELLKHLITVTTQPMHQSEAQRDELLEVLTKREREVAIEAAKGLSNKEIARLLSISERTVKAHLTAVFSALNVKDRLHLALVLQGQFIEESYQSLNFTEKIMATKVHYNS